MTGAVTAAGAARLLERAIDVDARPAGGRRAAPVEAIARAWRRLGLSPGDLVIVALPNGVEILDHFFGLCLAGGVPAIVSPGTPPARLRDMAGALGARALLARHPDPARLGAERAEPIEAATALLLPGAAAGATRPGEVVLLTSGTSGIASACVFDLDALVVNATLHREAIGQRADDTVLVSLPLYYSFALVAQALATLGAGGALVVGRQPFHVGSFRRAIAEHGATVAALTPVQVRSLLAQDGDWPAGLRALSVGGDALSPRHVEALLRLPGSRELYVTYGLTQAGPRVSTLAAHAEPPRRFASVGRPLAGVEAWLRDGSDDAAGGELLVRTPSAMKRRLGRVEGRAADWASPGVLATGDVFTRDEAGYLAFQGRLADFVVINGEKVCLASVRRLAAECPGVLAARTQVSGPRDAAAGYEMFLTVRDDAEAVRGELEARLRRWLRAGERPLRVHVATPAPGEGLAHKP